jgi:serine/threonine protein kinase
MTDLRDTLQSALGAAYVIERELGGGGMSRVFVATETAFNRRVAIKVVPVPDTLHLARVVAKIHQHAHPWRICS